VPGIERLDEIVFHQVLAARHVDHVGAVRQLGEGGGIQDAHGVAGERQQAHQDVRAVQEGVQLAAAGVADHAIERLGAAAPAQHLEAVGYQLSRRRGAELAKPHDADPPLGGLGWKGVGPLTPALRPLEAIELAMMAQHREQDVFGHGARERRIDHAGDRHVRQIRVGDQAVDAGPERQDRPEIGVARQLARRRAPHQGDVDLGRIADLRPDPHVEPRNPRLQLGAPSVRRIVRAQKQQRHDKPPPGTDREAHPGGPSLP
jgi:hypothetical protein